MPPPSAPSRYFGGNASNLGVVHGLAQSDFSAFVKEVLGHPAVLNLTRKQFYALDEAARNKAKRVPYITPATFATSPSQRVAEKTCPANLVFLDIDDSNQARPFARNPDLLRDALQPFAFAVYTTAKSTPDNPRIRVVVSAQGIPAKSYSRAVSLVGQRLGLPHVSPESRVFVQPMYVPTLFRDDDPIDRHPLLIAVLENTTPLRPHDLNATPPKGQTLEAPPQEGGGNGDTDPDPEELDFLRTPVEGLTLPDLESALNYLDPDMAYPDWLSVAAALRHQCPREPESVEAYLLFDRWSSKGKKYTGGEDTRAKWDSLRPNPRRRVPVTARSILYRAAEAGWDQGQEVARRSFAGFQAWLLRPERSPAEMLAEGVKRIAALPLVSMLERSTLLSLLQEGLRKHQLKVPIGALNRDLKAKLKLQAKLNSPNAKAPHSTPDNELPRWARGIAYVAGVNQFFQRAANRGFSPEVADNLFNVYLMDGEPSETNGRPMVRARDYLLNVARVPRVDHFRYDPGHPEEIFVQEGNKRYLNIYLPTYPEPDPTEAEEAGELFHQHIKNLLLDEEYQHLLLDFLAYHVRNPGKKIRWAVLLQGAPGCGKTFLADAMTEVLGVPHVRSVDASTVLSRDFNDWAYGAQIVAMEEVRVVGHNRYEIMNRLKPCISNSQVAINQKYRDIFQMPNLTNYLMFTNHHDALAIQEGDRRYFVLQSQVQTRQQVARLGTEYFVRLYDMIHTKAAGLRHWLSQWKPHTKFNPNGHAPHTVFLAELMSATASPLFLAARETISEQEHPLVHPQLLSSRYLRNLLELQGGVPAFSDQALASVLRDLGYEQVARTRLQDERHYLWCLRSASAKWKRDAIETATHWMQPGGSNGTTALEEEELL